MIYFHQNYRDILKEELGARVTKNPSYSLRAFAKDLEVTPALISQVNNGKKNISPKMALHIASKMKLTIKEQEYFYLLVCYETSKQENEREILLKKINSITRSNKVQDLDLEYFRFISDWYHVPIMAMLDIPNANMDPRVIAKKLGISPIEAEVALHRLENLGFIKQEGSSYHRIHTHAVFSTEGKNQALRKFHKQLLDKAKLAIDEQASDEKFIGSETFAIDKADVEIADQLINEFMDKMISELGNSKTKNCVYHLNLQFFNLTKEESDAQESKTA